MERVDGNVDELLHNLNNEHNMTPERIKDILELIINALNFLKANKITHGDLFLRNIGYKLNTEVSSSVSGHSGRFFDLKLLDWSRAAPNNFPKHFVRNGDGDWIESTYNEDYDTWTILKELKRLGLELTPADLQNSENLAKALKPYFDNISKFNSLNAVSMCPWIKAKYNELKEHQDILELLRVSTDVETTLNQQNPFTTIGKTRFLEYIKSWGIEELYEWVSLKRQIETYSKQLKYCPHESTTFQIPLNLKFSAIHLKTKYDKYAALQWIKKNSQLCFNLSCDEKYNTKIDCNIVHNDIAFFQKVLFSSENFVYLYDDNNNVYGFGLVRASRSEPNVQNLIGMCVLPSIASTFMNSLEAWVKSHAKQDQIYLQLVISLTDNGTDFFTKRGYVFYSHNNLYRKELT
jgi:serine/threonine protein kinase